jgi:hypothetical protein
VGAAPQVPPERGVPGLVLPGLVLPEQAFPCRSFARWQSFPRWRRTQGREAARAAVARYHSVRLSPAAFPGRRSPAVFSGPSTQRPLVQPLQAFLPQQEPTFLARPPTFPAQPPPLARPPTFPAQPPPLARLRTFPAQPPLFPARWAPTFPAQPRAFVVQPLRAFPALQAPTFPAQRAPTFPARPPASLVQQLQAFLALQAPKFPAQRLQAFPAQPATFPVQPKLRPPVWLPLALIFPAKAQEPAFLAPGRVSCR